LVVLAQQTVDRDSAEPGLPRYFALGDPGVDRRGQELGDLGQRVAGGHSGVAPPVGLLTELLQEAIAVVAHRAWTNEVGATRRTGTVVYHPSKKCPGRRRNVPGAGTEERTSMHTHPIGAAAPFACRAAVWR
jgi:hypothetical protein